MVIPGRSNLQTRGAVSLYVDGKNIDDRHNVSIELDGDFSSVALVNSGGSKNLLPNLLDKMTGIYVILLGAGAFLIDKLITIYKFLGSKERVE